VGRDEYVGDILKIKANEIHYFLTLFGKELSMFRTDLLPIMRSLNTVFTEIGICHTGYDDCLLATGEGVRMEEYITTHGPLNVKFAKNKQNKHINIRTPKENCIRPTWQHCITKYTEFHPDPASRQST